MTARVLVVDDSFGSVALLKAHLKHDYLEIVTASEGAEALTAVTQSRPDLIVLDLVMPGIDGFEVCRRIKSDPATTHIPILILSSLDTPNDRARALNVGADAYMTKPMSSLPFLARVRTLLQSKRVIDELRFEGTERKTRFDYEQGVSVLDVDVSGGQVLLVADDRGTMNQIRLPLESQHQVYIDQDAEDALLVVQRAAFDVVVVDLALRSTEGLRLCSRLRSLQEMRRTPLLTITRDGLGLEQVRALEMGVSDFVMLPVHPAELTAIVNAQVRRKRYCDRLRRDVQQSLERAVKDPLTNMHNRRYLETHLAPLVSQNVVRGRPVSLLILDIDHFKLVNDTYGHDVGDLVLREIADRISVNLRGIELCCRFGGEEFVAAFSGVDTAHAVEIGERLCQRIADEPVSIATGEGPLRVTISVGVATTSSSEDTADSLLKRADLALYRAKKEGRNRVVADA
jgi:two-component system cell cycle response regulator